MNEPLEKLMKMNWIDFSVYPKKGENILLHIFGYSRSDDKTLNRFVAVKDFDPITFDIRAYIPMKSVKWKFEWCHDPET